jgi:hypothetical protein
MKWPSKFSDKPIAGINRGAVDGMDLPGVFAQPDFGLFPDNGSNPQSYT